LPVTCRDSNVAHRLDYWTSNKMLETQSKIIYSKDLWAILYTNKQKKNCNIFP
jgi:hypothetical protein